MYESSLQLAAYIEVRRSTNSLHSILFSSGQNITPPHHLPNTISHVHIQFTRTASQLVIQSFATAGQTSNTIQNPRKAQPENKNYILVN